LYFENKDIRAANNNISRVDASTSLLHYLYTNNARANFPTVYEDVNGNFVVQNLNATNSEIEADYAWVYFSLSAPFNNTNEIYINGMFNNYSLTLNSKWITIQKKGFMKKLFIKTRIYKF
jgi:hypothetical protein